MLRSQLSIMGLYNYNEDIFSGFQVPEEMDRETAIEEIVMQCAELELIYPSYTTMKLAIRNWTKAELPIWIRAYKDMTVEYNPIWNVDGTETETIERSLSGNVQDDNISRANMTGNEVTSGNETSIIDGEEVISGSTSVEASGSKTETNSGKAYNQNNEATWTDREKVVTESSDTTDTTQDQTTNQDQTTTTTQSGSRENEESISGSDNRTIANTETETITTTKTRGGNIGVTMTQQMLNADLDMLPRLNPYQFIVDSFKNRFCLLVY